MDTPLEEVTYTDNIKLSDDGRSVVIIDQTLLPNRLEYIALTTREEMFEAIAMLRVRGAPAIGICAGYCAYCLALQAPHDSFDDFYDHWVADCRYLNGSRPTAVNLSWALNRMLDAAEDHRDMPVEAVLSALKRECLAIHSEDMEMCRKISEYGLSLLHDGDGVLTHCNAGPLATSRYGTGQGPLFLAKERGMDIRVFADETRPLLQGARLTSFELYNAGVDVTLICDSMASIVMKNGWVQCCMVGCDRVAANGDTANKIGTSGVAILAKHYGIPFYVLGPTSTIDMSCTTGEDINIELRDGEEIRNRFFAEPVALPDVKCYNPPYVTETEKREMEANVLDWEPELALFVPDEDPLRFYRRIAELGRELLRPDGKLYFEINQAYGQDMIRMIEMNQYRDVRVIKDIFGKDRIVTANR